MFHILLRIFVLLTLGLLVVASQASRNVPPKKNVTYVDGKNLSGNLKITTLEVFQHEEGNVGNSAGIDRNNATVDGYETRDLMEEQLLVTEDKQTDDIQENVTEFDLPLNLHIGEEESVTDDISAYLEENNKNDTLIEQDLSTKTIEDHVKEASLDDLNMEESATDDMDLVIKEEEERLKNSLRVFNETVQDLNLVDPSNNEEELQTLEYLLVDHKSLRTTEKPMPINLPQDVFDSVMNGNLEIVQDIEEITEKLFIVTPITPILDDKEINNALEVVTGSPEDLNKDLDWSQYSTEINVLELINGEEIVQSLKEYKERQSKKMKEFASFSLTLDEKPLEEENLSRILGVDDRMMEEIERSLKHDDDNEFNLKDTDTILDMEEEQPLNDIYDSISAILFRQNNDNNRMGKSLDFEQQEDVEDSTDSTATTTTQDLEEEEVTKIYNEQFVPKEQATEKLVQFLESSDEDQETIVTNINNKTVTFNVKIMENLNDSSMMIPKHSQVDVLDACINITWHSNVENLNNSLAFDILTQSNQMSLMKVIVSLVVNKTLVVDEYETQVDLHEKSMELNLGNNRSLHVSDTGFLTAYSDHKTDLTASASSTEKVFFHIEIMLICAVLVLLIALTLFLVLRTRKTRATEAAKDDKAIA